MDYKSLMGYSNKQKKPKKSNKNRKPTLTENLMNEFGGLKLNKVYTEKDLPPFAKSKINEGPAYEYEKMVKSIEKSENKQAKEVNNLVKTLQKKGFKKEATNVANAYMKSMRAFNNELDDIIRGLM